MALGVNLGRRGKSGHSFYIWGKGTVGARGSSLGSKIEVHNAFFVTLKKQLKEMARALRTMYTGQEILVHISKLTGASVAKNFKLQRGRKQRWPHLSLSTKSQRKKQGFHPRRPILVRGGSLFVAATQKLEVKPRVSGNPILVVSPAKFIPNKYDPRGLTAKTYFNTHNLGMPGKNVPTRGFFWIRHQDFELIGDLMVATIIQRATAVARRRQSDPIANAFSFRIKDLNLTMKDFLHGDAIAKGARVAINRVRMGRD